MFAWFRCMIKALYCWASIDSNTHAWVRRMIKVLYCSASIKHRAHVLSARIRYSRIHKVCINLNRSSATHRSQLGNTWCNTITFLFGTDTNVQPIKAIVVKSHWNMVPRQSLQVIKNFSALPGWTQIDKHETLCQWKQTTNNDMTSLHSNNIGSTTNSQIWL